MSVHRVVAAVLGVLITVLLAMEAFAYDAVANFSQAQPELVSGFFIECGPTKGGPYLNQTDCGKPVLNADGTYDCALVNFTANPVFCVASNYDAAKRKIATSSEATMSITVQPPSQPKLAVKITTVSRLSRYGKVIADTTVNKVEVPDGEVIKEGTSSYRNSKGHYVTNTIIAWN